MERRTELWSEHSREKNGQSYEMNTQVGNGQSYGVNMHSRGKADRVMG